MGYSKVDTSLQEVGVAVDMQSDGTLFVKVRASSSKVVERERTKQQQPYRNILMHGRNLPPGVAVEIGRKVIANSMIVGIAGTIADGLSFGKIEGEGASAKPVEFEHPGEEAMTAILRDYPDFSEDVTTAANSTVTFEASKAVDDQGEPAPSAGEAEAAAAGN